MGETTQGGGPHNGARWGAERVTACVVVAVAYIVGALVGFMAAGSHDAVTAVWPPTGIAIAAVLVRGTGIWPGIAIGAVIANVINGTPVPLACAIAIGNTAAPLIAARILDRADFRRSFDRLKDVVTFVFVAMGAMTVSASLGTLALWIAGVDVSTQTWVIWWSGDAMGAVLMGPFLLTLFFNDGHLWRHRKQGALLFSGFIATTVAAVITDSAVGWVVVPIAMAIAMVLEQQGAATAILVLSVIDVGHMLISQPGSRTLDHDLAAMQGINATIGFILYALASVMHERRVAQRRLEAAASDLEQRVEQRTSELVHANERLQASEVQLSEAQRLAHIGSFQWDAAADRNDWTDELFRIYGLDPSDGPPGFETYISFIREDVRDHVRGSIEQGIAEGRAVNHEYPVTLRDGRNKWVHAYIEVIKNEDGSLAGLRGTCQDVTDRKNAEIALVSERNRVEDALRTALDREREASEDLRKLDRAKNAFLSAVSHELRTPLTAILGFSELLEEDSVRASDEMTSDLVSRVRYSAERLNDLLGDLLDLDRLHRGIVAPRRRPTSLRSLVSRAVAEIDVGRHAFSLIVDDAVVLVDPAQCERIIENLVTNAVRYTPDGSVIALRAASTTNNGVDLLVDDDGPGVAHELWPTIFEPFVRGDTGTFTQGTGIGLSLVDRFARLHGGQAEVADRPGGGARFHVSLPGSHERPTGSFGPALDEVVSELGVDPGRSAVA